MGYDFSDYCAITGYSPADDEMDWASVDWEDLEDDERIALLAQRAEEEALYAARRAEDLEAKHDARYWVAQEGEPF